VARRFAEIDNYETFPSDIVTPGEGEVEEKR
jgi:hypothetical protein